MTDNPAVVDGDMQRALVENLAREIALYQRWGPEADSEHQTQMRFRIWENDWPEDDVYSRNEDGAETERVFLLGRCHYRRLARHLVDRCFKAQAEALAEAGAALEYYADKENWRTADHPCDAGHQARQSIARIAALTGQDKAEGEL